MQKYLGSMEGAVLSGKQCAQAIARITTPTSDPPCGTVPLARSKIPTLSLGKGLTKDIDNATMLNV